jgi:hypothetical protein
LAVQDTTEANWTNLRATEDFLPFVNPDLSNFYPICKTVSRRLRVAS